MSHSLEKAAQHGVAGAVAPGFPQPFPQPSGAYPAASAFIGPPTEFMDPTAPRPNDILPLHPAIIQQRQIAARLPPCTRGGHHELRTHQYVETLDPSSRLFCPL